MARSGRRELEEYDAVFSALAHATRRHVLLVLNARGGSMTAGEIAERFSCSWPTTSRHLKVLRDAGLVRAVGFSGKTPEGARTALVWADVIMVTYNGEDQSHEPVLAEAREMGVGVLVKKGLASGRIAPEAGIPFVLANPHVASVVVGGLNLDHIRANVDLAEGVGRAASAGGTG